METHTLEKPSQRNGGVHLRSLFQDTLLLVIGHLVRVPEFSDFDADELHAAALDALIHATLGTGSPESAPIRVAHAAIQDSGIGPVTPEQVGDLYEFARGFRLTLRDSANPTLGASAAGKRNQGLFYTPQRIVQHIVCAALDAVSISDPTDYLNLRVLDPSVGTGTFLLAALDELTGRVLAARHTLGHAGSGVIRRVQEELRDTARKLGMESDPDEETAIRAHIMSTCLYGVDLDPLAVRIARIALKQRAFTRWSSILGREPRIRVGNALIGSTSGTWDEGDALRNDDRHAQAYFGMKGPARQDTRQWVQEKRVFHWAYEFPEVFRRASGGFDCVIGNPPYEILSVKESGIRDRHLDQSYFRATYRTCQGKINTYRLMIERGLDLLHEQGVLGFIVPATLLADSTAEKLRKVILDDTRIIEALVIPEKAQVFERVTQALLVLICRKGTRTRTMGPVMWDGTGPVPSGSDVSIGRDLIARVGFRIPRLSTRREKSLLELLMKHPPLAGNGTVPAVGRVHQGEMNLTVDRAFITGTKTDYPLIRGEHVMPLRVSHPSPQEGRLDWVIPEFLSRDGRTKKNDRNCRLKFDREAAPPRSPQNWEQERIVLGRVVNMETKRRLKAALVSPGQFLGDMTNFIAGSALSHEYLLGLLNSRLLNWRIKLTSANNYLSAAEVESLPVPRVRAIDPCPPHMSRVRMDLGAVLAAHDGTLADWVDAMRAMVGSRSAEERQAVWPHVVAWIVSEIRDDPQEPLRGRDPHGNLWNALDSAVLFLYGCESYVDVIDG